MTTAPLSGIVLLGHSGYIGSRLADSFRRAHPTMRVAGVSAPDLDLTRDGSAAALARLIDEDTAVVVCAAIKKQLGDSADVFAKNEAITLNVCRALAAAAPRRVVFFSSAAVYGEDVQHDVITEATPVQPTSFYGIGKYTAERLLLRMVGQRPETSLLILRPALVYGPNEPGYYYGPSGFLRMALARSPITLWGDGRELREFLLVDDVVEVATRLTLDAVTGVLNIVSGTSYTYLQALDVIEALTGDPPAIASRPRSKEKVDHRFDASALRRAVAGFEFTPLDAGLHRVSGAVAAQGSRA